MKNSTTIYIAFCLVVITAMAWAHWRGWAPGTCSDLPGSTASWSSDDFEVCGQGGTAGSGSGHSIRGRNYHGGK